MFFMLDAAKTWLFSRLFYVGHIDTIDQEHSVDLHCDLPYIFSIDTVVLLQTV